MKNNDYRFIIILNHPHFKTRLLITNSSNIAEKCDKITLIKEGQIIFTEDKDVAVKNVNYLEYLSSKQKDGDGIRNLSTNDNTLAYKDNDLDNLIASQRGSLVLSQSLISGLNPDGSLRRYPGKNDGIDVENVVFIPQL